MTENQLNYVEASKETQQFLRCISDHLSGRKDCRGVEYEVTIDSDIRFIPSVHVYPSRYNRSKSSRTTVVSHVITYHFPELFETKSTIDTNKLIKGTYKYQLSVDKKSRRWIKIK